MTQDHGHVRHALWHTIQRRVSASDPEIYGYYRRPNIQDASHETLHLRQNLKLHTEYLGHQVYLLSAAAATSPILPALQLEQVHRPNEATVTMRDCFAREGRLQVFHELRRIRDGHFEPMAW